MANLGATFRGKAEVITAGTPTIYNVSVPFASTEVSQVLSSLTKMFTIRVRDSGSKLQLAFVTTDSGTKFITIPRGNSYTVENLNFSGTLFFQTSVPDQIVEILEWV